MDSRKLELLNTFLRFLVMIAGALQCVYSVLAVIGLFVALGKFITEPLLWFGFVHVLWMFAGGLAACMLQFPSGEEKLLTAAAFLGSRCGKGCLLLWCGSYPGMVALFPSNQSVELPWWMYAISWCKWRLVEL